MLYLMDELKMDARAIEKLIYQESGLLGVSGISSDMRVLLSSDAPRAKLAVELFVYRIGRELGSLVAAYVIPTNEELMIARHTRGAILRA